MGQVTRYPREPNSKFFGPQLRNLIQNPIEKKSRNLIRNPTRPLFSQPGPSLLYKPRLLPETKKTRTFVSIRDRAGRSYEYRDLEKNRSRSRLGNPPPPK